MSMLMFGIDQDGRSEAIPLERKRSEVRANEKGCLVVIEVWILDWRPHQHPVDELADGGILVKELALRLEISSLFCLDLVEESAGRPTHTNAASVGCRFAVVCAA